MPVKHYSAIADTYRLILVCPYGSKNGPYEPSIEATYAVLEEVKEKYTVDPNAIFLSGFSGGARLATLMAMKDSQFKGVIACGATFPENPQIQGRRIPYVIVIGNKDMNYTESVQSRNFLEENKNPSILIEFNGNHEWPGASEFAYAIAWQMARIGRLLESAERDYMDMLQRAKHLVASQELLMGYSIASIASSTYDGSLETSDAELLKNEIFLNPEYQKARRNQDKLIRNEVELLQEFKDTYGRMVRTLQPDTAFIESQWQSLRTTYESYTKSKNPEKKLSGERLVGFARLLAAEQSYFLLENGRLLWALNSACIWTVFDSGNPNAWVMRARIEAGLGRASEAIYGLERAVSLGSITWSQIESDPDFENLRDLPAIKGR